MDAIDCLLELDAKAATMLAAARAGDWKQLASLELEERALASRLAAIERAATESTKCQESVIAHAILEKHAQIAELVLPLRDDLDLLLNSPSESAPNTSP